MIAAMVSLLAAAWFTLPFQTTTLDDVGAELRNDPVYVDPQAERAITDAEADELRAAIRDAGTPVFVAVLPESAATTPDAALDDLLGATQLAGTYAVVLGDSFRANSTQIRGAGELASGAFQQHRDDGTAAVLEAFVADVARTANGAVGSPDGRTTSEGDGDGDGGSLLPLAVLGGGGLALYAWSRSRRRGERRAVQAEFDADVQLLRAELSVLADDVMRLEPQVVTRPEARADYEAATTRFRAASAALDYADEPVDLVRVERVVREAEYAMSRARAIVDGREPPEPSEDLRRPGRHDEPALDVDRNGTPVYVGAGPFYGGGWFGGGGGLFSGLLLGSMLGGGFGPFGWGHHHGGWGGGAADGDWGGGDWGGGFGGGDWGGGDIGGGDW
ncbi:MAG TPA: hypothetical protein VFU14_07210 [Acidimicrobiales bacterium]|nr:hypothetical protein [Acidimicrobiales bacterium]